MSRKEPDFENLQKTLLNKKTDSIPMIELGIHPAIKRKVFGRPVLNISDDIEFMRKYGYDFIKIQPSLEINLDRKVVSGSREINAYSNEPDRAWASEESGIITTLEDFEKYPWPSIDEISYKHFEDAKNILPDNMGIIGQYGDIFTMVWDLMGFETFAMAIYENPELISLLFNKIGSIVFSMFENMAQMDWVGCLWYSDDIAYSSGLMINPDFLREYLFPYLRKIGALASARGIPFIYHSDGVLWDVASDILDAGVTALHPIEPKSMDIHQLQAELGDKLCLCGGIEVDLLARGNPEEVVTHVKSLLETVGSKGGWCAGSSNSIPDYVSVDNYLAMIKTIREFS